MQKVSVDREQRKNIHLDRKQVQPTQEQLSMAFEAASLLYDRIGDVGREIEVVKVTWWQPSMYMGLDWEFKVVIDSPCFTNKVEIQISIGTYSVSVNGNSEPNFSCSFDDVEELTRILVEAVRREIVRKQEGLQLLVHALEADLRSIPAAAA